MKKRLIILSDLWGNQKASWVDEYLRVLENDFYIQFYDCCELGEIDTSDYREAKLHEQFVKGGIERAVQQLIKLEKEKVVILAFSIGGAIAWKFGLASDKIDALICISSTRLRHETVKPNGNIKLYFGSEDAFKPSLDWFEGMRLDSTSLIDAGHQVYIDSANQIADSIRNYLLK